MYIHRITPIAVLLALAACRDQAPPTGLASDPLAAAPATTARQMLVGYVVSQNSGSAVAYLRTASALIPLHGAQAAILAGVEGAEVSVLGTPDAADGGFIVESFTVLTVKQRPVIDGVLVISNGALFLRQASGAMYAVVNAPPTLQAFAGARLWIAPADAMGDFDFGVIEAAR